VVIGDEEGGLENEGKTGEEGETREKGWTPKDIARFVLACFSRPLSTTDLPLRPFGLSNKQCLDSTRPILVVFLLFLAALNFPESSGLAGLPTALLGCALALPLTPRPPIDARGFLESGFEHPIQRVMTR
jgi:hypothetical protein